MFLQNIFFQRLNQFESLRLSTRDLRRWLNFFLQRFTFWWDIHKKTLRHLNLKLTIKIQHFDQCAPLMCHATIEGANPGHQKFHSGRRQFLFSRSRRML